MFRDLEVERSRRGANLKAEQTEIHLQDCEDYTQC